MFPALAIDAIMTSEYLKSQNLIILRTKELKFFLVSQVLSFRLTKETSKNVADTTFNGHFFCAGNCPFWVCTAALSFTCQAYILNSQVSLEWFVKLMLLQNILCIFTWRDILPSSFQSFINLFLQNQKSWTTFLTSCLDMPSQACLLLLINWTSSSHVNIAESKCFLKIPSHLSSKRVLIVLTSGISFLL